MKIGHPRQTYRNEELKRGDLLDQPFAQFRKWLKEALAQERGEPNAMALATADKGATPSSRMVLLKELDERGFCFYTNLLSKKSQDIKENPKASLTFFWEPLIRQVHIRGYVEAIPKKEACNYFKTRPRENQLGSWASQQDQILSDRKTLEDAYKRLDKKFRDKEVPPPPYWGGYRVIPSEMEFWQGRPNRLHDRFLYTLNKNHWSIERLSP